MAVPRRYVCEDGYRLGEVLRRCLSRSPDHHVALREAIRCEPWPISTLATFRNEALAHLWAYVREHGIAGVPTSHVCADGFRLGSWINRCRRRRGADAAFDAMLESFPGWMWKPSEEVFAARVRLAEEAARSGRLTSDLRLRAWVGEQRRAAHAGVLDKKRVGLLREAGLIDVHLHRG